MKLFSMLIASLAPGAALLTYVYLRDKYRLEPIFTVMRLFLFGVLVLFPTMIIQRGLLLIFPDDAFIYSFIISAGLEEFIKWFVLFFVMYKHVHFDEPYDGIVYAVAISIGFASFENFIYTWSYTLSFFELLMRALLPVSAHALFAIVMGYYIGKAKFSLQRQKTLVYLIVSLLFPIVLHGLFNYIQIVTNNWFIYIATFMVLLWILGLSKLSRANKASPFRYERSIE